MRKLVDLGVPVPARSSFLNRLYRVVSGDRHRLEDFLTEVLGELLGRLSVDELRNFMTEFLLADPHAGASLTKWQMAVGRHSTVTVRTQQPILISNMATKRPDIVIYAGATPLAIIECKIRAGFTWSETLVRRTDSQPQYVEQLAAYGSWLRERGDTSAALILLTQYSDPPEDFYGHPRFGVAVRGVRRWSDLCAFLRNPPPSAAGWVNRTPLVQELVDLITENDLMIADLQSSDFAAARLYMGMHAHLRLVQCVNSASVEIRKLLLKNVKGIKFSKPRAQACYDDEKAEAYICDWGWSEFHEIGWGFWFCEQSGISSWAKDYDPPWTLPEGVAVYVEFFKNTPTRPNGEKADGWLFPVKGNTENTVWNVRAFQDFLTGQDSTKKIASWLEQTVREAVDLTALIKSQPISRR